VAGFHAWRKLGRFVKKGEHGIAIFAPMMSRRKDRDERKQTTTEGEESVFGFRIVYVFDVEQTEGDSLPEFAKVNGDATGWMAHLENAVRDAGVALEYGHIGFPIGAKGMSTPGAIKVSPSLPESEKFAVLVHEFAHELLHQRTDRKGDTTRRIRETEAEAVAYTVCRAFGIDSTTRSSDYIQLYRGTEDTLRESLGFVQQTATRIIEVVRSRSTSTTEMTAAVLAA
jgi:antirestriction protein ArdC